MKDIKQIFNIAKRDKWVVEYDSDLDTFYWTKPKISPKTSLRKFLEDFSLYVTPKGLIEGLFIEYAKHNFVPHNKEYKPLFDQMVKVEKDTFVVPQKNLKSVEPLLKEMAHMVANEALEAAVKERVLVNA